MADNEHVIAGSTKVVALVRAPSPMPEKKEDRQLFVSLVPVGNHKGAMVAIVQKKLIPRMRALGAEITVIDDDPNAYALRVESAASAEDLVASVEERLKQARDDMAIAQAGSPGNKGKA